MNAQDVIELSESQHALVARRQVRDLGYSNSAVTRMWTMSPYWAPITREVVRRVGAPITTGQRLLAAVLDAGGDAVPESVCAMRWWGHRGCSLEPIRLATTSSSRRTTDLAVTRRVRRLERCWTTQLDGVPIVRPELLSLQLFDECSYERAERLTEWLWSERLLSGPSIHRFLERSGARGRNGTAGLREYLRTRPEDYVPAASGLEARAMQLFEKAFIPMRRQVDVGAENWTGRVDFLHAEYPVVVEIQSDRYHRALVDEVSDARRMKQLRADGFEVVELTDDDVWARPWTVAQATDAGIRRRLHTKWPDA